MKLRHQLIGLCFAMALAVCDAADDVDRSDSEAGIAYFESKIRPVLVEHCYECHSAEAGAAEGELQLDTRAAIRKGGDRGPAVVPGKPAESWLLQSVTHDDADLMMPPKRDRLPDAVIADLKRWIEMGAPDPRPSGQTKAATSWEQAGRDFWAYQPPQWSELPPVSDATWPKQSLDYFILAALEKQTLAPSDDAEPHVLLRRLHFDLVGLPPSPDKLASFLERVEAAGLDTALAEVVDHLLATPQFGERWGRHWLDVARFAESSGTEANISFPYAWRYRDYVIDSVNADVPYDRFLSEQIAGDLLPAQSNAQRARLLIATGFLALGPKNLDAVDKRQFHADVIDEQIDTVTRAVIANSVACARCHDHKFDPFSMEDYYALAGIFASTNTYFGTFVSPANRIGGDPLTLPEVDGQLVLHASLPAKRIEALKEQLAELQAQRTAMDAALAARLSGKKPEKTFTLQEALRNFWQTGSVEGQLEKVSDDGQALPLAMGTLDRPQIVDAPLLQRGDVSKPAGAIPRALPQSLRFEPTVEIPDDQSGRLQLAEWLTDPKHPLTSRVMVNRIWQHLLGAGIVATVDHFGSTGEPPSHPELLDHLALQFMQNGWSTKQLVRDIVLSRAYRQSSAYRHDAFRQDPENRLLWRVPKRRLEAECIRDAMLAASEEIDLQRPTGSLVGRVIGDKPISLIGLDERLPADLDGSLNRSIYLPVIRDRLPDVLDLFDFAEPSLVTGDRETTNVPIQALYLMNSPFVLQRARGLAERLTAAADDDQRRVHVAFVRCFSRPPEPEEMKRSLAFLRSAVRPAEESNDAISPALIDFCQSLLCTGEFRNLD